MIRLGTGDGGRLTRVEAPVRGKPGDRGGRWAGG